MKNPRIEATWQDLAVIRQTVPARVMPVDEPFPFFPTQTPPAFDNCCTTGRCHRCK
jgi:hypothetical protein